MRPPLKLLGLAAGLPRVVPFLSPHHGAIPVPQLLFPLNHAPAPRVLPQRQQERRFGGVAVVGLLVRPVPLRRVLPVLPQYPA